MYKVGIEVYTLDGNISFMTDLKPIDDVRNIIISDIVNYCANNKSTISDTGVILDSGSIESVRIRSRFFNKGRVYVEYVINDNNIQICYNDRVEYIDLMNYSKVAVAIKTAKVIIGMN